MTLGSNPIKNKNFIHILDAPFDAILSGKARPIYVQIPEVGSALSVAQLVKTLTCQPSLAGNP